MSTIYRFITGRRNRKEKAGNGGDDNDEDMRTPSAKRAGRDKQPSQQVARAAQQDQSEDLDAYVKLLSGKQQPKKEKKNKKNSESVGSIEESESDDDDEEEEEEDDAGSEGESSDDGDYFVCHYYCHSILNNTFSMIFKERNQRKRTTMTTMTNGS